MKAALAFGGIVSGAAPSEPRVAPLWWVGAVVLETAAAPATGMTWGDGTAVEAGDNTPFDWSAP